MSLFSHSSKGKQMTNFELKLTNGVFLSTYQNAESKFKYLSNLVNFFF
jgi:hypothetical protein